MTATRIWVGRASLHATMTAAEWFGLALRIIGTLAFLYGGVYLLDAILLYLGYFMYLESSPQYFLVVGILYSAVGLYLMRGGSHLVRFAYPPEDEEDGDTENESDPT